MKNIFLSLLIVGFMGKLSSQVSIEKPVTTNASTILDFNDEAEVNGVAKSLILPWVQQPNGAEGAILFDTTDQKVKYRGENDWVEMTEAGSENISAPNETEMSENVGVIISDETLSTTDVGVLKLESNNKAVILPRISNVETALPNPEAGSIVYDMASKSIAVFNGTTWSFWN